MSTTSLQFWHVATEDAEIFAIILQKEKLPYQTNSLLRKINEEKDWRETYVPLITEVERTAKLPSYYDTHESLPCKITHWMFPLASNGTIYIEWIASSATRRVGALCRTKQLSPKSILYFHESIIRQCIGCLMPHAIRCFCYISGDYLTQYKNESARLQFQAWHFGISHCSTCMTQLSSAVFINMFMVNVLVISVLCYRDLIKFKCCTRLAVWSHYVTNEIVRFKRSMLIDSSLVLVEFSSCFSFSC